MRRINYLLSLLIVIGLLSCNSSSNQDAVNALNDLQKELDKIENTDLSDISTDKFHSVEGKFKINFPGTPQQTQESIPTDVGKIEMVSFMYEKSVTEAYMVAYSDYPSEMVKASDTKTMLNDAKNGFLGELGLTVDKEEEITIDGFKGISFKAKGGTYYTVFKDVLVNNRLYQFGILKDGSYPSEEAIKSFIDSFELVKE